MLLALLGYCGFVPPLLAQRPGSVYPVQSFSRVALPQREKVVCSPGSRFVGGMARRSSLLLKAKGAQSMSHGMGGESPANVQKYLKGVDYPAKKRELVDQARKNAAPDEVVQIIQKFPDQEFVGPQDVMKAYGQINK
jgi:hypothetical protein